MSDERTTTESGTTPDAGVSELPLFQQANDASTPGWALADPMGPDDPFTGLHLNDLPPARVPDPEPQPVRRPRPDELTRPVDRALVRALRKEAAELLREHRSERQRAAEDPTSTTMVAPLSEEEEREFGRETITNLVRSHITSTINAGHSGGAKFTADEEAALVKAVFDAQFNLGPLQPLVDEADITDILINGAHVYVQYPDGHFETRPSVVDDSSELLEWLSNLAARSDNGGRPFSRLNPSLRLTLPGGHRLSAMAFTSKEPSVAIRLHRLVDITLDDLVDRNVMPTKLARLLHAATRGGTSVVTSGPMGSGKTTLTRALANALPIQTRIGTAETELELFLKQLSGRERYIVEAEAITGGGERGNDGELYGSYTLSDILYDFVRQNLDLVIVGEVAGPEIVAMFKAMQMVKGSLSTTHAEDAKAAIDRLVTCAMEHPSRPTTEFAERQVGGHINLIVQLNTKFREVDGVRQQLRYVDEVLYLEPGEDARPIRSTIYRGYPDGTGHFGTLPRRLLRKVLAGGYDRDRNELPVNDLESFDENRELELYSGGIVNFLEGVR